MKAVLLIFVLALTAVYGFYSPSLQNQEAAFKSNEELFKAISDYFYSLSTGSAATGSLNTRG